MVSRATTLLGAAYIFVWLVYIFALSISCVALLSQAVRTSRNQSWKKNINVLIIGIAYVTVVREQSLAASASSC